MVASYMWKYNLISPIVCTLTIAKSLSPEGTNSNIWQLINGIALSYFLNYLLGKVYLRCSDSMSNRYTFSKLLPLISSATCLLIYIVKSSLALSLGLVGALSIVRFRTAIKDPEELIYLFVSIALGLASGAGQYSAAIIGFIMISAGSIFLKIRRNKFRSTSSFRLMVEGIESSKITLLIEIMKKYVDRIDINSLVSSSNMENRCSLNFAISVDNVKSLIELKTKLSSEFTEVIFNFIEVKSI